MGELVADDECNPLLPDGRGVFGIDEETGLAVSDETPVFHGACAKVRDGDQVDLRQGVGDVEVVLVVGQDFCRNF